MADFGFWPVVANFIFRTPDTIHRLLILASSSLYLILLITTDFQLWTSVGDF